MEEPWNKNMADEFKSSWINVISKRMMEWYNKFIPRFMYVGRKPHPFGNDSHTIYCGLTSILWRAHIVKVKDRPAQLYPNIHLGIERSARILIWVC